jgi:hypothetical protein
VTHHHLPAQVYFPRDNVIPNLNRITLNQTVHTGQRCLLAMDALDVPRIGVDLTLRTVPVNTSVLSLAIRKLKTEKLAACSGVRAAYAPPGKYTQIARATIA